MPFGSVVVGPAQPSVATVPERLRTIVPIARADAPARRDVRSRGRLSLRRGVDFMVNGEPHHHGQPLRVGELQVIAVRRSERVVARLLRSAVRLT